MKKSFFIFIFLSCCAFCVGQNTSPQKIPTVKIHTYYSNLTSFFDTYDLFAKGKLDNTIINTYKNELDFKFDGEYLIIDNDGRFLYKFKVIEWQYVKDTKSALEQPYERYIIKANRILEYEDSLELFYFYISWNDKNEYIIQEIACDKYGEIQIIQLHTNRPQN